MSEPVNLDAVADGLGWPRPEGRPDNRMICRHWWRRRYPITVVTNGEPHLEFACRRCATERRA